MGEERSRSESYEKVRGLFAASVEEDFENTSWVETPELFRQALFLGIDAISPEEMVEIIFSFEWDPIHLLDRLLDGDKRRVEREAHVWICDTVAAEMDERFDDISMLLLEHVENLRRCVDVVNGIVLETVDDDECNEAIKILDSVDNRLKSIRMAARQAAEMGGDEKPESIVYACGRVIYCLRRMKRIISFDAGFWEGFNTNEHLKDRVLHLIREGRRSGNPL